MTKQNEFIKSSVFLQLGQAIEHESWQSAMMKYRKLEQGIKENDVVEMQKHLAGLRMAITHREKMQAQNILARITVVRVKMLKAITKEN